MCDSIHMINKIAYTLIFSCSYLLHVIQILMVQSTPNTILTQEV